MNPQEPRDKNVRDSVAEKRVKQIYELLDSGAVKKAISEADKTLKKLPNCHTIKALKALALVRLRNYADARTILNELKALQLTDDYTLQAMTFSYLDMRDFQSICEIYEKAYACDATNEELGSHLFMAYVRTSDFVGQKKIATQLHRCTRKPIYLFWSATSVLLQAIAAAAKRDTAQCQTLAKLARKMLETRLADAPHRFDSVPETELYLFALRVLGNFEDVRNKVTNPEFVDGLPLPHHRCYVFESLYRLRMLDELHTYAKSFLIDAESGTCRDTYIGRWDIWQQYIGSGLRMIENESKTDVKMKWSPLYVPGVLGKNMPQLAKYREGLVQPTLKAMFETIQEVHAHCAKKKRPNVSAFLSELQLAVKLQSDPGVLDVLAYRLDQMIFHACCFFGKKTCTSDYLKPAIAQLRSIEQRFQLGTALLNHYALEKVTHTFSDVRSYLTALQVVRMLGHHLYNRDVKNYDTYVDRLLRFHQYAEYEFSEGPVSDEDEKFDQDVVDSYALLAVHYCFDNMFVKRTSDSYMLALESLHNLLNISPKNYHAKLLCIKIYHFLGCAEAAQVFYESLDIKQFQLDSLAYVHSIPNSFHGRLRTTQEINEATLNMFENSELDVIEHMTFAYKLGTFSKIYEFMHFRDKLRFSANLLRTTVNQYLLEVCFCHEIEKVPSRPASLDGFEAVLNSCESSSSSFQMYDNQDYDVFMHWNPTFETTTATGNSPPTHGRYHDDLMLVIVSRLRFSAIVKLLVELYQTSDHSVVYEMCHGSGAHHLKALYDNWTKSLEAIGDCQTNFDESELQLNHGANLNVYRASKSKVCIGTTIEYVQNLAKFLHDAQNGDSQQDLTENLRVCEQLSSALHSVLDDFNERCAAETENDDIFKFELATTFKERFAVTLDIFEYTSVVLLATKLTRRLIQYVAGNRKSKKERKSIAQTLRDNWTRVHKSCATFVQDLLNGLAKWRAKFASEDLRLSIQNILLTKKDPTPDRQQHELFNRLLRSDIEKVIVKNRQQNIEEVELLLKEKMKQLTRLAQDGPLVAVGAAGPENGTSPGPYSIPDSLLAPWNQGWQSLCSFYPKQTFPDADETAPALSGPDDGPKPSTSQPQKKPVVTEPRPLSVKSRGPCSDDSPAPSGLPDTASQPSPLSPEAADAEVEAATEASSEAASTTDAVESAASRRPTPNTLSPTPPTPPTPPGLVSDREAGNEADDERSRSPETHRQRNVPVVAPPPPSPDETVPASPPCNPDSTVPS